MHRSRVLAFGSLFALAAAAFVWADSRGRPEHRGEIRGAELPPAHIDARQRRQAQALARLDPEPPGAKQILFGDLHVHTTFSLDAFFDSLPLMQGEGAHPPADACDFARFCSDLDFWSITDHAESLVPHLWRETRESIRQCNAVAGDPERPDLVSFLGFEWTQIGTTPENHYGHKNVIFRDTEDARVPARAIASGGVASSRMRNARPPAALRFLFPYLDIANRQLYQDLGYKLLELAEQPLCPEGVDVRALPEDCAEWAPTPRDLFEKLAQWGFDSLVIPHGTAWGWYTPAGSSLERQLAGSMHDPSRQTLIEVYSGHGNSEEYRPWRAVSVDAAGNASCPDPSDGFVPCCHRAGEIIRGRCGDVAEAECARRVEEAERNYLAAGRAGRLTVPGATWEDWKNCGQCPDCFAPAFHLRPGGSVQYALAIGNFDQPGAPRRFRFGFVASSDNHSARPGTGYKEFARLSMTDARGGRNALAERIVTAPASRAAPESVPFDPDRSQLNFLQLGETERQASFFLTGGLVAVHAEGRDRDAIWAALRRSEVYGTSGDRMLLWFDLLNAPGGPAPMGSQLALDAVPSFRVRAVGALEPLPGCPDHALRGLPTERLEALCRGECYNPGDERRRIARIEVIRIRPQIEPGEPVAPLIEDPWRVFSCAPDPAGCVVEFEDSGFPALGREVIYYARAIQEPTPAVNAGGLRCEVDASGACAAVRPCFGDTRSRGDDDCLSPHEERAWSSPIRLRGSDPG